MAILRYEGCIVRKHAKRHVPHTCPGTYYSRARFLSPVYNLSFQTNEQRPNKVVIIDIVRGRDITFSPFICVSLVCSMGTKRQRDTLISTLFCGSDDRRLNWTTEDDLVLPAGSRSAFSVARLDRYFASPRTLHQTESSVRMG